MAEYINIRGQSIEVVASDPANPTIGQIWYNSTSNTLKGGGVTTAGAWATGNNLNTSRRLIGGAGTQTAGLAVAGLISTTVTGATEEYDGNSWTSSNSLNTPRWGVIVCGTQTAGLGSAGTLWPPGVSSNATEEYDGNSWTSSNPLNSARTYGSGTHMGTQTAGLAAGGYSPALGYMSQTEEYDGNSWTSSNPLITARAQHGGTGIQTASICFGGDAPAAGGKIGATEEYDGTSWTTSPASLNTIRSDLAAAGTQTAALGFAGNASTGITGATEEYDGISWASSPASLNTARDSLAGAGTQTAGLAFGGSSPSPSAATEEWTGAGSPLTVTITAS